MLDKIENSVMNSPKINIWPRFFESSMSVLVPNAVVKMTFSSTIADKDANTADKNVLIYFNISFRSLRTSIINQVFCSLFESSPTIHLNNALITANSIKPPKTVDAVGMGSGIKLTPKSPPFVMISRTIPNSISAIS